MVIKSVLTSFIILSCLCFSCKRDETEMTVPYVQVFEEINLNSLSYQNLKNLNGHIYLDDLGYKGILVVRIEDTQNYRAYDRTCPYHPYDECALINVHSSGFFLEDDCCGSLYSTDSGWPTNGPATSPPRPLRSYNAFVNNSNYLVISNY